MELNTEGAFQVKAPIQKVWDFVIDPNKMGKCLPDLKSLEVGADSQFTARVRIGVGVMKGDFKFQLAILDQRPPSHARLKGGGTGVGSSVNLDTLMDLVEVDGGTKVTYKAAIQLGGSIASLGQRVMGGTVERTVAQVFDCVKRQLES